MKKLIIGIVAVAAVAVAAGYVFPALRGPVNRVTNTVNETLEDEYVVDNYKAQAISLVDKRKGVVENLRKFTVEKKVAEKKSEAAKEKLELARKTLIETGTADMAKFNRARELYETCKADAANNSTLVGVYDNAIKKLEDTLAVIDSNLSRIKVNVSTLQTKKDMARSLEAVNTTIENISGIGDDHSLGYSLEKLDDTILTQSLRVEALNERESIADKDEANKYLEAVKSVME